MNPLKNPLISCNVYQEFPLADNTENTIELHMHKCSRCYGGKFCRIHVRSRALMGMLILLYFVCCLLEETLATHEIEWCYSECVI